jgi:exopolysaccharide biosynthesis polyprenyl glycosylphosphotransferase
MAEGLERRGRRRRARLTFDGVMVSCTWALVLVASNITAADRRSDLESVLLAVIAAVATLFALGRHGFYTVGPTPPRTEEISWLISGAAFGTGALAIAAAVLDWYIGAWELVLGLVLVVGAHLVARALTRAMTRELMGPDLRERIVIVGVGGEAAELVQMMQDHPETGTVLVGVVGHRPVASDHGLDDLWLGPADRLIEVMQDHDADAAFVTATGFRGEQLRQLTRDLLQAKYDLHLSIGAGRLQERRFKVRTISHEPLIVVHTHEPARLSLACKRALDVLVAGTALLVLSPLLALVALAIKLDDRGPVLYRSQRTGLNGTVFGMFKFRSMVVDAERRKAELVDRNERTGPLFKVTDDPRITRVGRFLRETSIDELPQLLNVLRGEMSLVGPRPALPEEHQAFDPELRTRGAVRPGITGLWQVEARTNASFNAYRRLDLHYVENWSLALDLWILLATAEQVVVSLLMVPLRPLTGRRVDGVAPPGDQAGTPGRAGTPPRLPVADRR